MTPTPERVRELLAFYTHEESPTSSIASMDADTAAILADWLGVGEAEADAPYRVPLASALLTIEQIRQIASGEDETCDDDAINAALVRIDKLCKSHLSLAPFAPTPSAQPSDALAAAYEAQGATLKEANRTIARLRETVIGMAKVKLHESISRPHDETSPTPGAQAKCETWHNRPDLTAVRYKGGPISEQCPKCKRHCPECASPGSCHYDKQAAPPSAQASDEDTRCRQFWNKHGMPPLLRPSCVVCGKQPKEWPPAIQHMELRSVIVCTPCRDAATAPVSAQAMEALEAAITHFDNLAEKREAWAQRNDLDGQPDSKLDEVNDARRSAQEDRKRATLLRSLSATPPAPEQAREALKIAADYIDNTVCACCYEPSEQAVIEAAAVTLRSMSVGGGEVDSQWRDISTAPRDGTPIMFWCPEVKQQAAVFFNVHEDEWQVLHGRGRELFEVATLWQPLPAAPVSA